MEYINIISFETIKTCSVFIKVFMDDFPKTFYSFVKSVKNIWYNVIPLKYRLMHKTFLDHYHLTFHGQISSKCPFMFYMISICAYYLGLI